jgi:hypothetical protein
MRPDLAHQRVVWCAMSTRAASETICSVFPLPLPHQQQPNVLEQLREMLGLGGVLLE